jgi:ArsR family transcriptional regulator
VTNISLFFAALADPSRLRLLNLLSDREVCVCHLQSVLKTNQPKISRHLAYLRKAGLVQARREGKWAHYSLKKLDPTLQQILRQTFSHLKSQPQIQKDRARLQQVMSNPPD